VHSLERENLKLKAKENLLALEIRKYAFSYFKYLCRMQTKLQRIDELMRNAKDRKYADGDYA
jgi:hypothetical protein